jgi:hypothetical protein
MTSLQEFVQRVQKQDFFDPDRGDIFCVSFARHFIDDDKRLLASKFSYFRVFHQRRLVTLENGKKDYVSNYWALPEDLKFALDGETFTPVENEQDRISVNHGLDWETITQVQTWDGSVHRFDGKQAGTFVKIMTTEILPGNPYEMEE